MTDEERNKMFLDWVDDWAKLTRAPLPAISQVCQECDGADFKYVSTLKGIVRSYRRDRIEGLREAEKFIRIVMTDFGLPQGESFSLIFYVSDHVEKLICPCDSCPLGLIIECAIRFANSENIRLRIYLLAEKDRERLKNRLDEEGFAEHSERFLNLCARF